jgi:outer membrane immunogenic protein
MKKLLIASAALAAVYSAPAVAADMAVKAAPRPIAPSCAQFGGGYVGVHGGSVLHDWNWNDNDAWARNEFDDNLPQNVRSNKFGYEVGARIGYDWQRGCTVFGVVADWSWSGTRTTKSLTDGDIGAAQDFLTVQGKLDWYGTVRTRGGVVVDNLLIYATGGLAYARSGWTATAIDTGIATETFSNHFVQWGGVVGVGTEWAFTPNWSLTSEFLYMRFADKNTTFNSAVAFVNGNNPVKNFTWQDQALVARIGLNYRFGGGAVLAKY